MGVTVEDTAGLEQVARFEFVYAGDRGERGKHLHASGLCDHSDGLVAASAEELYSLDRCGQCLNRAVELGLAVPPQEPPEMCPTCFLVGVCDCEN